MLNGGFGLSPVDAFVNDADLLVGEAMSVDRLVERYLSGTLQANVGVLGRLVLGAQLSVQIVPGPDATLPGQYNEDGGGLDGQGLGNFSLHAKLRLLRTEGRGVGLAALLRAELPTGDAARFRGDPRGALRPSLIIERRPHSRIRLATAQATASAAPSTPDRVVREAWWRSRSSGRARVGPGSPSRALQVGN